MNAALPAGRQGRACAAILAFAALTLTAGARNAITDSTAATYTEGSDSLPYRLYKPTGFNQPGSSFPIILFLHGAGERGNNNTSQVTSHIQGLIDKTEGGATGAYLLAPQAPSGTQWTDIPFGMGSYSNPTLLTPGITTQLRLALNLVEQFAATNNVDISRIYITGLSMGGYGTWDAIARRPSLFAAAVPLSGGGNLAMAGVYDDIPIWAFHGTADGTVPVSGSRNTITAIQNAGGTKERYTDLTGQGHVIWSPIYDGQTFQYDTNYTGTYGADGSGDMYGWMFSQSIPEPGTASLLCLAGAGLLGFRRRAKR